MKDRKVLLVNPWIYDFAAYDLWVKPLGLLSIGALLRKNGCEVALIDCLMPDSGIKAKPGGHGRFHREIIPKPDVLKWVPRYYARYGISFEAFMAELDKTSRPDAVLVTSMMTYWYPGVFEAIRIIKERFRDVPVILGGVYATLCHEHARQFSGADHIITRSGELKALGLLEGIWGKAPEYTPDMDILDSLPYPCFDLIDDLRYVCIRPRGGVRTGAPTAPLTICAATSALGCLKRWPMRSDSGRGITGCMTLPFMTMPCLTPQRQATRLLEEIISRDLGVSFHCPNGLHAREITPDTARLMKEAGFVTIRLGLETTDPLRQRQTGGKVTNREFVGAMENLRSAGYGTDAVGVYILCGLPGQKAQEVMDAVRFVKENGGRPRLSEYSPIPHTKEWEEALKSCRYPIEEEPLLQNNTLLPCRSDGFTYEQFQEIKRSIKEDG
jgi:radical SAM superfamily enzyme YgiQ (UPF0313 family)